MEFETTLGIDKFAKKFTRLQNLALMSSFFSEIGTKTQLSISEILKKHQTYIARTRKSTTNSRSKGFPLRI